MPRKVIKVFDEKTVALVTVSAPDEEALKTLTKEIYKALEKRHNTVMWSGNA